MLTEDTSGLWCSKDKKFYYLEAGPHQSFNSIDRIKRILVKRGLISWKRNLHNQQAESHRQMTWREARNKGYDASPIYMSDHVRTVHEAQQTQETSSPWS